MMILLDWAILISLITAIIYCWKLNNKISELKKGRKELQDLINSFDRIIEKTEINIKELKELSIKTSTMVNDKFDKAKFLADDLSFMTERATNLADKLEGIISSSRKVDSLTLNNTITESPLEKHYSKKPDSHEFKKSTIESLLAKIATVKETNKKANYTSVVNQANYLKKTYPEEV